MLPLALSTGILACLAALSLGGGLYEYRVVDPVWPKSPALIQPGRGGIDRKRFWITMHTVFEVGLLAAVALAWSTPDVRTALLVAFASHALMRVWSFADFIPKALAFESAAPSAINVPEARAWVRRSLGRLPLSIMTCGACFAAFALSL